MERAGHNNIFGFYHLCAINTWREVAHEQLRRWTDSGLLHSTRRIFASVVGPAADEGVAVLAAACGERLEVVQVISNEEARERELCERSPGAPLPHEARETAMLRRILPFCVVLLFLLALSMTPTDALAAPTGSTALGSAISSAGTLGSLS